MTTVPTRAGWRKSSYSGGSGGNCVEVANLGPIVWHKSSRSTGSGGHCVEVAELAHAVGVRDSKDPEGPHLAFGRPAFRAFVRHVKAGTYDQR